MSVSHCLRIQRQSVEGRFVMNRFSIKMYRIILVLLAITIMNAPAAVWSSDIVQDQFNSIKQIHAYSGIGQTFTADDSAIDSIGFYFVDMNPSYGPLSLTLNLYSGSGFGGSSLGSQLFSLTDGFNGWYDVDFSTVSLTVGDVYSVEIIAPTQRWAVQVNQHSYASGATIGSAIDYVGGDAIIKDQLRSNNDLRFHVKASNTPPVVPEPLSAVLFIAGGSLFVFRGYWKKRQTVQG